MLIDIMDFDPRITSDGDGYGAAHGVHCNFHYGYVLDVYDEDAKNVAACVQALHHLIAKADTDIGDLEDELAILQCQRKWEEFYEHTDPFEVCCEAFKRRINSLTSTIQRSRDGDTVSEIQRPAEKISDIINALIESNFKDVDEQEEDVDNEMKQAVSSDSQNIDTDVRQPDTTLKLSIEPEQRTPVVEMVPESPELMLALNKPTETISEESSSVATRYTIKDLTEAISRGSSNVEISDKIESAEHSSKEKTSFLTSVETIASQTPLQASNGEGNTKPTAPLCEEIESMCGSKTGESRSPILVAKTEQDGQDTNMQHDSTIESLMVALENQAQNVSDLEITHGQRKSGLSKIFKPSGQKVMKKNLDDVKPFSSSQTLKPQKTIKKRKPSAIKNFGQSSSPSSDIEKSYRFLPETNWPTNLGTEENIDFRNPLQLSVIQNRHPQGTKIDSSGIPKPRGEITLGLKSLGPMKVKDSSITSLPDTLTPESKSSIVESTELEFDFEELRRRKSEEPNFQNTLTAAELREILKLFRIRGVSKFKKDRLIEEVSKCLATL